MSNVSKLAAVCAVVVACGGLCGCSGTKELTDGGGNPIAVGEVCYNTVNGRVCYIPNATPLSLAPVQTLEK